MEINTKTVLTEASGWHYMGCVSDAEVLTLSNWLKTHSLTCKIAQVYLHQSCGSGIGTNTVARCFCGEGIDITDYEEW